MNQPLRRKTFSGAGRPRSNRPREKNGRPQRISIERQEANAMAVALAQPHRKGSRDDRRRWPIGRMILDEHISWPGISADELHRAAEAYDKAWGDVRWLLDSKRPFFNAVGGGRREPTEQERAQIERIWGDMRRVLRDAAPDERAIKAMEYAILDASPDADYRTFNSYIPFSCAQGLAALVDHLGLRT